MELSAIEAQRRGRAGAISTKARVVSSLILRALMEENGRQNIGFLWIIMTPLLLCSGVLVVRSLITSPIDHGVSLIAMIFSGYLPLTLFRHLTNGGVKLLQRNQGLYYHRQITALDTVVAMIAMETISCTIAFVFVYWVLSTVGLIDPIVDWGLVACGWLTMALLSGAIGCFFSVLTAKYERAEKIIQPAQYLILPVCGFIFLVDWLPYYAQQLAWWVPMVHCYEMLRSGMFSSGTVTHYDAWYPILVSLLLLGWSVPRLERARQMIYLL